MYTIEQDFGWCIHFRSADEDLIVKASCFERARRCGAKGLKKRDGEVVEISGQTYSFTRKEWEKGKLNFYTKGLRKVIQAEKDEMGRISKRLCRQRTTWIIIQSIKDITSN